MLRRPPRSTHCISSAASDVYKRQVKMRYVLCHYKLVFELNVMFQDKKLYETSRKTISNKPTSRIKSSAFHLTNMLLKFSYESCYKYLAFKVIEHLQLAYFLIKTLVCLCYCSFRIKAIAHSIR
eukprot:TRINITY_DN4314_c0_g1_i3.p1 TRINITY_DN4314_c0_g1~~TRINITY_DN4314_c0_g1_i3.p1  ORF type:complete len:132 (-),score=11.44 TRINITY_DN4314_c0_g1_i3:331-702(-)